LFVELQVLQRQAPLALVQKTLAGIGI